MQKKILYTSTRTFPATSIEHEKVNIVTDASGGVQLSLKLDPIPSTLLSEVIVFINVVL